MSEETKEINPELIDLYFRIRDVQARILTLDGDIERLNVERERFEYEEGQLSQQYNDLAKTTLPEPIEEPIEQIEEGSEEVKPRKLKKTNVQPS